MSNDTPNSVMGRPTIYSDELVDCICDELMVGRSLRKICEDETMPHISTVMRWIAERDDFCEQYARARQVQAEYLLDELIDIADDSSNDYEIVDGQERLNQEHIQRAKLRIDTRKWNIEKLAPKKYGVKQQVDHTTNGKDLETVVNNFNGDAQAAAQAYQDIMGGK